MNYPCLVYFCEPRISLSPKDYDVHTYLSLSVLFCSASSHELNFMLKSIGFDLCIEGMVVPRFSFSLEGKRVKLKLLWEDSPC